MREFIAPSAAFVVMEKKKEKKAQRRRRPDWFHKFLALLTNHSIGVGVCLCIRVQLSRLCSFSSSLPLLFSHSHSHLFLFRLIIVRLLHCQVLRLVPYGVSRWDFCTDEINRGRYGGQGGFIFCLLEGGRFSLHC